MFVEGVADPLMVTQVTDFIRTCIDGEFEGWEGDTIFVLCNGQVWVQSSWAWTWHWAYRPDVLIYWADFEYRMGVEGVDETIAVKEITNQVEWVDVVETRWEDDYFKIWDLVVRRSNGQLWALDHGVGCLGIYSWDTVLVYSPTGLFAGIGSKIIDGGDQCRIWASEQL